MLVLVVLPDPRRLRNENDIAFGDCRAEGPFNGPGHDACCCDTNDDSRLYAGVDGSDGLSVNTGVDTEAEYILECGGGGGGGDPQSELCAEPDVRNPRVEGKSIEAGSSVDATYRVRARGAGAMSSVRSTSDDRWR